jgi:hypothetical protein
VCRGVLAGSAVSTPDNAAADVFFDATLNSMQSTLGSAALGNLHHALCRHGELQWGASGSSVYPITTYLCEGPLASPATPAALAPAAHATQDLQATRFGASGSCALQRSGSVLCTFSVSTQLVSSTVTNAQLTQRVQQGVVETHEQVYGASPPFYRDMACQLNSTNVYFVGRLRYMVGNASCSFAP